MGLNILVIISLFFIACLIIIPLVLLFWNIKILKLKRKFQKELEQKGGKDKDGKERFNRDRGGFFFRRNKDDGRTTSGVKGETSLLRDARKIPDAPNFYDGVFKSNERNSNTVELHKPTTLRFK